MCLGGCSIRSFCTEGPCGWAYPPTSSSILSSEKYARVRPEARAETHTSRKHATMYTLRPHAPVSAAAGSGVSHGLRLAGIGWTGTGCECASELLLQEALAARPRTCTG